MLISHYRICFFLWKTWRMPTSIFAMTTKCVMWSIYILTQRERVWFTPWCKCEWKRDEKKGKTTRAVDWKGYFKCRKSIIIWNISLKYDLLCPDAKYHLKWTQKNRSTSVRLKFLLVFVYILTSMEDSNYRQSKSIVFV